jgi:hypothetical protein
MVFNRKGQDGMVAEEHLDGSVCVHIPGHPNKDYREKGPYMKEIEALQERYNLPLVWTKKEASVASMLKKLANQIRVAREPDPKVTLEAFVQFEGTASKAKLHTGDHLSRDLYAYGSSLKDVDVVVNKDKTYEGDALFSTVLYEKDSVIKKWENSPDLLTPVITEYVEGIIAFHKTEAEWFIVDDFHVTSVEIKTFDIEEDDGTKEPPFHGNGAYNASRRAGNEATIIKDYQERATAERAAGTRIEINTGLPYISIEYTNGENWFFQEHEAQQMLDEIPEWIVDMGLSKEDYILAMAQGW